MKTFLFFIVIFISGNLFAQAKLEVGGSIEDSNVFLGNNNTVVNQIFGKSPEYAELKNTLATLEADIQKRAATCEKMVKDNLPAEYRDGCRSELIALNARRDSVQKIETRFREDVIRLAESFSKMELNSERLRLAKQLFDEGKIREADNVLNAREIKQEGDALLVEKARELEKLTRTDSLLHIKAEEFALKAQLKAMDYSDLLRYDSVIIYFEQGRKYRETIGGIFTFANLLNEHNQTHHAISYFEAALSIAHFTGQEAAIASNLGNCYSANQKMEEAEKMHLHSIKLFKQLAQSDSTRYEPLLAEAIMRLGNFYAGIQKNKESEREYLLSLEIYTRLAKHDSIQFEPGLAMAAMNLGVFYTETKRLREAEEMYLWSFEICSRLAELKPVQFEPQLAIISLNLGVLYARISENSKSEKMYLQSFKIYNKLAKAKPAQFEPYLATVAMNLGVFYQSIQKWIKRKMLINFLSP